MPKIMAIVLAVVTALLAATKVQAQNNGDIRLINYYKTADDSYKGRLEVLMNGRWGTICGKRGTDFQAVADTAC